MKIIVLGARGDVGSRVVNEAIARGHDVTAVVRNSDQLKMLPSDVSGIAADAGNKADLAEAMAGQDRVVSALRAPEGQEETLVSLTRSVLEAAAESETRVLLVGGAASLKLPDNSGHTVLTAPGFLPDAVVPIARACQAQYEMCLADAKADWSYLCPPAMLLPGDRTNRYRLGTDTLLVDEAGASGISMEDFALALIDEAEEPRHRRKRFTVAS